MDAETRQQIQKGFGGSERLRGALCPHCKRKDQLIDCLDEVAKEAAKLFQKGGQFEYCVDSNYQKKLQDALKKAGYL